MYLFILLSLLENFHVFHEIYVNYLMFLKKIVQGKMIRFYYLAQ